ncbi:glycosyltransferase [Segetibacter koreensis]|uniref:glycosyltransferase n=1 Tax=Segetibacter koreensis TaxID=398037 RepID=UPI000360E026|nr:glycosyltransferase [Segetibacter koreensis]
MPASNQKTKILFISTFPPKKCGIASFTHDLINAINMEITEEIVIDVCALDKKKTTELYDETVSLVMDGYQLESCLETAKNINNDSSIKLICIEHEFGLYGGELGEYLLAFLSLIEKPFVIRFHTVLPAPAPKMLKIVQAIGLLADKVIVMTKNSSKILKEDYLLSSDKIIIIPHGTHAHSKTNTEELKVKYGLDKKHVLTTFGLLSPNKGIEKGIIAMKEIRAIFPEAVYIVLGQTHPNLLEQEGEKYRNYLQQLIEENGLQENVRLVNEYAPIKKLMEYLALTDIYLFTSKDPNQAVSGTFLYAMSAGCPIISNSFVLAKEMLDETTGVILSPGKDHELAENAIRILRNPELKKEMSNNAFLKTRNTTWEKVGQKHANLFYNVLGIPVLQSELVNQYIN